MHFQKDNIHPSQFGIRSMMMSIIVNIFLIIIKVVAGVLGNSYALIADAIESTSDILTSIIVWIGLKTASKAPDEDHPYGHGKAEPLAAIVVSLFLVIAAILITIQSIHYILTPHRSPAPFTLGVLLVVVVVKELLYRKVQKTSVDINSIALKGDAWHHRSDALTSFVVGIGISVALIGGKGYESADDWAALIAVLIILYNTYKIFSSSFAEIMDTAPPAEIVAEIKQIALSVEKVKGIDKCLVRKMGFEYFVDLHVMVDANLTVREGHTIAHHVKDEIIRKKPQIFDVLIHIEPFS